MAELCCALPNCVDGGADVDDAPLFDCPLALGIALVGGGGSVVTEGDHVLPLGAGGAGVGAEAAGGVF
jgi:hypothetical protein